MIVIRPVSKKDWNAMWNMAHKTGPGFSSLQPQEKQVKENLRKAQETFSGAIKKEEELYIFCLEDTKTKELIGISGIIAGLGLDEPWYNFRLNTVVHASQRFNIFQKIKTLTLCNDYTGCSELCMLFLLPEYRRVKGAGQLLSKSRFLFLAMHQHLFSERIIAELRGFTGKAGASPFWEALGRKFIGVDFIEADQALSQNRSFIIELMPKYPFYVNMLPEEAQRVIGLTHDETVPAMKMLYTEGFKYRHYVAPFDAGPVLEAYTEDVRAIRKSFIANAAVTQNNPGASQPWLVSNQEFENYRCILISTDHNSDTNSVTLTPEQAEALNIKDGDQVRMVSLYPERK